MEVRRQRMRPPLECGSLTYERRSQDILLLRTWTRVTARSVSTVPGALHEPPRYGKRMAVGVGGGHRFGLLPELNTSSENGMCVFVNCRTAQPGHGVR